MHLKNNIALITDSFRKSLLEKGCWRQLSDLQIIHSKWGYRFYYRHASLDDSLCVKLIQRVHLGAELHQNSVPAESEPTKVDSVGAWEQLNWKLNIRHLLAINSPSHSPVEHCTRPSDAPLLLLSSKWKEAFLQQQHQFKLKIKFYNFGGLDSTGC